MDGEACTKNWFGALLHFWSSFSFSFRGEEYGTSNDMSGSLESDCLIHSDTIDLLLLKSTERFFRLSSAFHWIHRR